MTGGSSSSYKTYTRMARDLESTDADVRYAAREERTSRLRGATKAASAEPARERAKAAPRVDPNTIDRSLARNVITVPPREAQEIHLIAVDNSGSNHEISEALCRAGGYIQAQASSLAGNAALAMLFFSDHCDGSGLFQWVDYVMPGKDGEATIRASVDAIRSAGGGDAPEAIECALHELAQLDFRHIPRNKRHLYLVTDVVAHGMGYKGEDDGCPNQRDWKESLREVGDTFGSFQVIATGGDARMFELQKQFIKDPQRLRYDLMDMVTSGLSGEERCRLVPNSVLFYLARNRGEQSVRMFLSTLFVKWMENPMYGSNTERRARAQIEGFIEYLDMSAAQRRALLEEVAPHISE